MQLSALLIQKQNYWVNQYSTGTCICYDRNIWMIQKPGVNSISIQIFYSTISNCRLLTEVPGHEELVNELGGDNCTALYYAASAGNQEVAKILLEKGGKKTIDVQDSNGQTALHLAIMTGNL